MKVCFGTLTNPKFARECRVAVAPQPLRNQVLVLILMVVGVQGLRALVITQLLASVVSCLRCTSGINIGAINLLLRSQPHRVPCTCCGMRLASCKAAIGDKEETLYHCHSSGPHALLPRVTKCTADVAVQETCHIYSNHALCTLASTDSRHLQ
jgi:hypothetical protein